jgi:hypothetical protein
MYEAGRLGWEQARLQHVAI